MPLCFFPHRQMVEDELQLEQALRQEAATQAEAVLEQSRAVVQVRLREGVGSEGTPAR